MTLLAELRRREGYSAVQVAKKIGVTRAAYSTWELDKHRPAPRFVRALVKLLAPSMSAEEHVELLSQLAKKPYRGGRPRKIHKVRKLRMRCPCCRAVFALEKEPGR